MIIAVEILFALLIIGIGSVLLKKRSGFMGLTTKQVRSTAMSFGIWFILLGVGTLISILIWGDAPWPATGFLVVATLSTTLLAMIISKKIFK